LSRFSPAERLLLYILSITLAISSIALLFAVNTAISIEVPSRGGALVEGELGSARFINPILAISDADQDLSVLIYSGLTRALPNGTFTSDLAQNYTVSEDGTTYTFILRPDVTFHDGTPVTAADVLYTVALAQNPDIKSPRRADWEGVVASSPDPKTVVFKLPHAYAPFIEDTTLGILPKHLWQQVQTDSFPFSPLNTHPIGSGPYTVKDVRTDTTGAPTRYDLTPFEKFTLGAGHIARISFAFYPNQIALSRAFAMHQIDAIAGVTPVNLKDYSRTDTSMVVVPLPRVFGIFFNQNRNAALADARVRDALLSAIDKKMIVEDVLQGYGSVLSGPLPPGILTQRTSEEVSRMSLTQTDHESTTTAQAMLKKSGWSMSSTTGEWVKKLPKSASTPAGEIPLTFKLATADEPELVSTAHAVAEQWRAAGINVEVQVYPLSDFNNTVLRPRNYDAILFGEVVSRSGDLFAFWHSSQRNDPGLNLSLYANSKADALLSKARASATKEEREMLYQQFLAILQKDTPALFLYSPDFIYIVPTKIHNIHIGTISSSAERFLNVYQWYVETERIWNFFSTQD
jgi:peptide/nickel transport system substrate-binding protein